MKRLLLLILVLTPFAFWEYAKSERTERSTIALRPRYGRFHKMELRQVKSDAPKRVELVGYPKATPEHAIQESRSKLDQFVTQWLRSYGVPNSWKAPEDILRQITVVQPVQSSEKDYGTVFVQPISLDTSDHSRELLLQAYEHQLATRHLALLAEVLVFVLVCLLVITGYIRADEATKGYYTNYLRVAAAVGLGGAGLALSRILS